MSQDKVAVVRQDFAKSLLQVRPFLDVQSTQTKDQRVLQEMQNQMYDVVSKLRNDSNV